MKKYFLILMILFSSMGLALSDTPDASSDGSWDDMLKFDREWQTGKQKPVTDAEFEKVMQRFEKKKKYKKYEFEPDETRDSMNDMKILHEIEHHAPTILFPADLRTYEGETIKAGYYTLNHIEKDNRHYLLVTQGRNLYAKIEMQPTEENFAIEAIQFAEVRPFENNKMKLIYGNLDINLEKELFIEN